MLQNVARRRVSLGLAASLVLSTTVALVSSSSSLVSAARGKPLKYEICHRTNAIKNPYRRITVAWSSVDSNGNGHDATAHDGPVFNIANPVASHGTTPRDSGLSTFAGGGNDRWGDIFRASRLSGTGNNLNEQNWTTAGQAIFNGATFTIGGVTKQACRTMSANDLIKAEKEENPNKPMSEIMAELDDQGATEDEALKQSLGGSFSTWYTNNGGGSEDPNLVSALLSGEAPAVTTEPPSNLVSPTSGPNGTATMNGTLSPQGASMIWYFEWGTDSTFANPNETTPSATGVTTAQNVSTGLTGLAANTVYYYRTVGVVSNGQTGDALVETFLYGATKQFVFGAPTSPTITSLTCGNGKLTVAFTAGTTNYGSVTGYEYSVDGAAYVNSGVPSATPANFDITGLVNGVSVSVAIRAITATVKGIDSLAVSGVPCGLPTAVTDPATSVQNSTATINGTVTSNGASTTVTFTWGTDPTLQTGTSTATATQSPLAPTALLPASAGLTGLTGGTVYYFRVNASNSGGSAAGSILNFTTPSVPLPSATTNPATSVTTTSATINGTGTSNGASSTVTFTWGTDPTLQSGTLTATASQSPLASGASGSAVSSALTGLTPATTYYFRTNISNANGGPATGIIRSFTTLAESPLVTTEPATSITTTTATVNGTGNPKGAQSTVSFTWGTDPTLNSGTTTTDATESPIASGSTFVNVTLPLTGLTPGTTYYFRTSITNGNGSADGVIRSFTTIELPATTTEPATSILETTATINGTGNPRGAQSTVTFTWGTDPTLNSGTTTTAATQSPLASGSTSVNVSLGLTGLTSGTTYYFRATITNTNGTASGIIRNFTTQTPINQSSGTTTTIVVSTTTLAPAPTTTAPSATTSTTSPPTTVALAKINEVGRVIGTAWFDTNRNNKRESNEPLLVDVPVELVPVGITAQTFRGLRKTAFSLVTNNLGSFDFSSVPLGTYRLVSDLPSGYGINKSWDSSGNDDWIVGVSVVSSQVARGDFAAVGEASMSGCYSGRAEASQLTATWNGFDKKLGTVDDATFRSKINNNCNFEVAGVPTGTFEVAALNDAGKVVEKTSMSVTSSGGTVKTASLSVQAKIQKELPQTGSRQMSDLTLMAMYAIVSGVAMFGISRRRRRV